MSINVYSNAVKNICQIFPAHQNDYKTKCLSFLYDANGYLC